MRERRCDHDSGRNGHDWREMFKPAPAKHRNADRTCEIANVAHRKGTRGKADTADDDARAISRSIERDDRKERGSE
ncbi:MAG: hypothetical protein FWD73_07630 [Polyangiaceae bacterium]|nr:hypothetical protein [Polyangiaceae bacterium]